MDRPGYVPGLDRTPFPAGTSDPEISDVRDALARSDSGRFYTKFPASTPKYAHNRGPRSAERTESMARFYIHGASPRIRDENLRRSVQHLFVDGIYAGSSRTATGGQVNNQPVGYFDFILSSFSINYQEREQAVDTISDNTVVFYSGMQAPVAQGGGALLNTYQDDQNVWFHYAYMECLRGSRLAARGAVASLECDSFRYDGYLTSFAVQTQAQVQNAVMFNFTFRVKQISVRTQLLYATASVTNSWIDRPAGLVIDVPTGAAAPDDESRVGDQAAVNPTAATGAPATVAASTANTVDPRATVEAGTMPPSLAEDGVNQAIAAESALVAGTEAALGELGLASAEAMQTSGDVAPDALPAATLAEDVPSGADRQLAAAGATPPVPGLAATARSVAAGSASQFVATGPSSTNTRIVSAGDIADTVAAAAQTRPNFTTPIIGTVSTLPVAAQTSTGSGLPSGFTDIYRVQGTVFAEAYARAASEVATARTASSLVRDRVGRRTRRRRAHASTPLSP